MADNEHAIANARAWLDELLALAKLLDGEDEDAADAARETAQEMPLSVQVRSGWYSPGRFLEDIDAAAEYEILLSTGGPALRIIGDLSSSAPYGTPRLQWQDWGTPWTDYFTSDEDDEALQAFVSRFYFGG